MTKNKWLHLLGGAGLTLVATGALADWTFNGKSTDVQDTKIVNNKTVAASDVTATATAYHIANGSGGVFASTAKVANSTATVTTSNGKKTTTTNNTVLGYNGSSGLGVFSGGETGSPNHAVDNSGRTDMILFSFTGLVELDYVTLGWSQNDADFSVLYYTKTSLPAGVGDQPYSILGKTWDVLKSEGWAWLNDVDGTASTTAKTYAVNGQDSTNPVVKGVASSWWIVSAYNTGFGGKSGLSDGNDYFKVASLKGTVHTPKSEVPEPTSLALLGLAALGLAATRRRAKSHH